MTGKVIAKRYQIWIDKFQEQVKQKQQEIEDISKLEFLYIIAKDVMEEANIDNETDIEIISYGHLVRINIRALPSDKIAKFEKIAGAIEKEFDRKKIKLFNKPAPSFNAISVNLSWSFTVVLKDKRYSLSLSCTYPADGSEEIKIITKRVDRVYSDTVYGAIWTGDKDSPYPEKLYLHPKYLPAELTEEDAPETT